MERQNADHHANAALLRSFTDGIELQHTAPVHLFFDTPPEWQCPCCGLRKSECPRLDRHGKLLLAIVEHHDHAEDYAKEYLRSKEASTAGSGTKLERVEGVLRRFFRTPICQSCNELDVKLKHIVSAPRLFSFSPREMREVIMASRYRDDFDGSLHRVYAAALAEHEANIEDARALLDRMIKRREAA